MNIGSLSIIPLVHMAPSWAGSWASAMVRVCWQGSLMILAIWLLCRVCPRIPPNVRAGLWWLATVKMLFAFVGPSPWLLPLLPTRGAIAAAASKGTAPPVATSFPLPASEPQQSASPPASSNGPAMASHTTTGDTPSLAVAPHAPVTKKRSTSEDNGVRTSLYGVLFLLWLTGLGGWVALGLRQYRNSCRTRNRSIPLPSSHPAYQEARTMADRLGLREVPALHLSADIVSPVLLGFVRPLILLPETDLDRLSPAQLRMALAHEMAHLKRRDLWFGLFPSAAQALFFFFPLASLACREYALQRESACDIEALRVTEEPPADYGTLLLRYVLTSSRPHTAGGLTAGAPPALLRRRIAMLEQGASWMSRGRRRGLLALCALALLGLLPWRLVSAGGEGEDPLAGNPLLEKKIVVTAEGLPVEELLTLISRRTGVTLQADRYVAEEKVIVLGPGRPLKAILTDVAALLHASWRHEKDDKGADRYALFRDLRTRKTEDLLANTLMIRIRKQIDEQVRALDETPEQLNRRPATDPIRKRLSNPTTRLATEMYARLSGEQRDALFEQTNLQIRFSDLAPSQQDAVMAHYANTLKEIARYKEEHPDQPVQVGKPEDLREHGLNFVVNQYFGHIHVHAAPVGDVAEYDSGTQWLFPAHGDPYSETGLPSDISLPDADLINASKTEKDWIARLRKLAVLTHAPIVADYYRSKTVTRPYEEGQTDPDTPAAVRALDDLCHSGGFLWWTRNKTLLFRKRDWYTQRQYEVPDSWLLALAQRLQKQKGIPTYKDVFSMMSLSPRQIVGLSSLKYRAEAPDILTAGEWNEHDLAGFHEALALAKTSWIDHSRPLQTMQLVDKDGPELAILPADSMTPPQRVLLDTFLQKQSRPFPIPGENRLYIRLLCTGYPIPEKPDFHPGWSDVDFSMGTQKGQILGYFRRINLPTELPDNRRGAVKVELVP